MESCGGWDRHCGDGDKQLGIGWGMGLALWRWGQAVMG